MLAPPCRVRKTPPVGLDRVLTPLLVSGKNSLDTGPAGPRRPVAALAFACGSGRGHRWGLQAPGRFSFPGQAGRTGAVLPSWLWPPKFLGDQRSRVRPIPSASSVLTGLPLSMQGSSPEYLARTTPIAPRTAWRSREPARPLLLTSSTASRRNRCGYGGCTRGMDTTSFPSGGQTQAIRSPEDWDTAAKEEEQRSRACEIVAAGATPAGLCLEKRKRPSTGGHSASGLFWPASGGNLLVTQSASAARTGALP